jgi:hypothetical protein
MPFGGQGLAFDDLLSPPLLGCDIAQDSPRFHFRVSTGFVACNKPSLTDISS